MTKPAEDFHACMQGWRDGVAGKTPDRDFLASGVMRDEYERGHREGKKTLLAFTIATARRTSYRPTILNEPVHA